MGHLGSFGAAVREVDPGAERDTFDFFGEKFTVAGTIPPMLMFELSAAAVGGINRTAGYAAAHSCLWYALTEPEREEPGEDGQARTVPADDAQFHRLRRLAVARMCAIEDLAELAMTLFEVQAARPTKEPQGSSPGPSTTSPSSNTSSSTPPAYPDMTPVADLVG